MWEKSQLSCSWGCCSLPGNAQTMEMAFQDLCSQEHQENVHFGFIMFVWPITWQHGNVAFLLFQVAFVWWCGKLCHSLCILWVIWGVWICPSHSFVLRESSLVLRKHRKEFYVQTRAAVVSRPHLMGTQYGSVQKHTWSRWSLSTQGQTQTAWSLRSVHCWGTHFM